MGRRHIMRSGMPHAGQRCAATMPHAGRLRLRLRVAGGDAPEGRASRERSSPPGTDRMMRAYTVVPTAQRVCRKKGGQALAQGAARARDERRREKHSPRPAIQAHAARGCHPPLPPASPAPPCTHTQPRTPHTHTHRLTQASDEHSVHGGARSLQAPHPQRHGGGAAELGACGQPGGGGGRGSQGGLGG